MHKIFLIYNPTSGQRRRKREDHVAQVNALFCSAGIVTEICATTHAGSAIEQTRQAVQAGFDTVIACGGDGTLNEALNGIMRSGKQATLGVVPLGSGNLLASDLRLPSDPVAAARLLLRSQAREIQPGVITSSTPAGPDKRYFLVAAGVGSDAELMYRTAVEAKERWGRNAYFLEMARMTLRRDYPMFQVEWEDEAGKRTSTEVSLVMAIRAARFPGLLRFVKLGSSLSQPAYRVLLFRTDKVRHFLHYFGSVASGMNWRVPQVDAVKSKWFRCTALHEPGIHSQADGELLGRLPVEVGIEQTTVGLLMPGEGAK
ncbi:MAG TPA: diacylglycerol kinase family protein [Terriglobales bacterium]|nr:diacylglycerol kinase family protein [Terriglobales bacterium]